MMLFGQMGMVRRALALRVMALIAAALLAAPAAVAQSGVTAFKQAVAEAAARDDALAAFYRARAFEPIWTGEDADDRARRAALVAALGEIDLHGLPRGRYDAQQVTSLLRAVSSQRERGFAEVELSRIFLDYARDIQTGVLTPSRLDEQIVREVPLRDRLRTLEAFEQSTPAAFLRSLPPQSPEYARLLKHKLALEAQLARGGWGPTVPGTKLERGASGPAVVALRERLSAMGFMGRSATATYDTSIEAAVQRFQVAHGLVADGVAGSATLAEINRPTEDRLASVITAMERERWINRPLGQRHIWVNLTDYTARIVDDGKVTFQTRSIIGEIDPDMQTPEFSDIMEYMEINPDWTVPRGIIQREYLPTLQRNPNALAHLNVIDARGRVVPRSQVNFANYTARTFPYNLRQPPSRSNALGTVKFMFPNPHAIYLHDTPDKSLFARDRRAFSNGCIRLNDPHDFAYHLLAAQTSDPRGTFDRILASGQQTRLNLETPVPVHLVYRTAFTDAKGALHFRRDIYGRDALVFRALASEGVVLGGAQG
jgi:murein L,D-transpeptidase YcbB/YkuD